MANENAKTLTIGGVTRQIEDETARQGLASLQATLNTLIGSGNVQGAIDTFNEVVAFLNDINSSDTLAAKLLLKADKATTYTKTETDNAIANAVEGLGGGSVESVTINGVNHTPINGVVNLGNVQGDPGPKGDTGNVQVDGNGNVLIVNSLTEGGTGAALSAEMGKRLAMLAGTFAAAWAHSKAVTTPFCWLWMNETVDGSPVCKPIWHVGNSAFVDAAGATAFVEAPQSVPAQPTMTINGSTATSGGSYGKNAELVITPAANSALYWRIGSGSYNVSDTAVTVTLPSGSLTIEAYCSNQKGNSQTASVSVTVAGTATPSFAAATGTTINNGVVSRGGSVVVSVPQGGELHYRINSGSWQTASGLSVTIPIATNLSQGQMVVEAYNVEDSDESTHVTNTYTMAALAAPTINPASGEVTAGSSVTITAPAGATLKVNGTAIQSQTTTVTITTNNQTITAVSVDSYGESAAATETYTIAVAKIKVKVNADTTMSLGDTGLTAITLSAANNNGVNEFTIDDINDIVEQETGTNPHYTSFADHTFTHLKFSTGNASDASKILTFDGGGAKFADLGFFQSSGSVSWGAFKGASNLTSVKGIIIDGGCIANAFSSAMKLTELEIAGTFSGTAYMAFYGVGLQAGTSGCNAKILISGTPTSLQSALSYCKIPTLTIAGLSTASGTSIVSMFENTTVTTLICTTDTPPDINSNANWLAALVTRCEALNITLAIKVPSSAVNAYKQKAVWSDYEDKISANTDN